MIKVIQAVFNKIVIIKIKKYLQICLKVKVNSNNHLKIK